VQHHLPSDEPAEPKHPRAGEVEKEVDLGPEGIGGASCNSCPTEFPVPRWTPQSANPYLWGEASMRRKTSGPFWGGALVNSRSASWTIRKEASAAVVIGAPVKELHDKNSFSGGGDNRRDEGSLSRPEGPKEGRNGSLEKNPEERGQALGEVSKGGPLLCDLKRNQVLHF